MGDLWPDARGIAISAAAVLGVLYGTIRLTRRRRMPPLLATISMAAAAGALPWIIRAVGGEWSFDNAVFFTALVAALVVVGVQRPYRDLYARDISGH